jgi:hypothetical protein
MSQDDLLYKSLDKNQVKKMLLRFISHYREGKAILILTGHFGDRCKDRNASTNDAINVIIAGMVRKPGEPHIKTGQIVYNVETNNMEVSFQFITENKIRIITIKRKGAR